MLETQLGRVYLTHDPDFRADDAPVLTADEIDSLLDRVSRIAPPDYLRRTLWTELRALVRLKQLLPGAGPASFQDRVLVRPPCALTPAAPPAPATAEHQHQQIDLLA